jgi:hypothetical protein
MMMLGLRYASSHPTALDLARARGDKVIIDLLLTHGATDRQAPQETPPA